MSSDPGQRDFMKLGGGQALGWWGGGEVPLWDWCVGIAREGTGSKANSSSASVCVCRTSPDTKGQCQHLLSSANNSEGFLRVLNLTLHPDT